MNENLDACLTDFGLTGIILNTLSPSDELSARGTLCYMAPELIENPSENAWRPTTASDVYALAMTLWEVRDPVSSCSLEY